MIWTSYEHTVLPGGQLYVTSSPSYFFFITTALVGIVPSYSFVRALLQGRSLFPLWGFVIWTSPWLLLSLVWLQTGAVTLDKASDAAILHRPVLFWHMNNVVPLHLIRYAEVRHSRASTYLALILNDESELQCAGSDQERGRGEAVEAIRRYLGGTIR